jgi:hypothetical protein
MDNSPRRKATHRRIRHYRRIEGDAEGLPLLVGVAVPAGMRYTRTALERLSATNKSPLGAMCIARGLGRPDATISAEKPLGTSGRALAGMGAIAAAA